MAYENYLLDARLTCRAYGEVEAAVADGLFPLPGDKPRYPRDRVADIKHVRLDVQSRPRQQAHHWSRGAHVHAPQRRAHRPRPRFRRPRNRRRDIVEGCRAGAQPLGRPAPRGTAVAHEHVGEEETIVIEFAGSPRRGMYFIGPDANYPWKRLEVWTQGQDEDSRHWFPCYDYPNEMATTETARHASVSPSPSSPTASCAASTPARRRACAPITGTRTCLTSPT